MSNIVDIAGLDKRELFSALYNVSPVFDVFGYYLYSPTSRTTLSENDFMKFEQWNWNIDYVHGVLVDVDISGNAVDASNFERHQKENKAGLKHEFKKTHTVKEIVDHLRLDNKNEPFYSLSTVCALKKLYFAQFANSTYGQADTSIFSDSRVKCSEMFAVSARNASSSPCKIALRRVT